MSHNNETGFYSTKSGSKAIIVEKPIDLSSQEIKESVDKILRSQQYLVPLSNATMVIPQEKEAIFAGEVFFVEGFHHEVCLNNKNFLFL